ncbi:hypothetical protein CVT26_001538 [Gymnopilus dilepis]|uniref:Uncharacterized protein n=1 Tax=Gymnopilus dilepis TaxID=231916 RepID=A0A409VTP5_9AGAR|nr:hypothetical protein CVT26_001538 [Gymnopilus dilepis]
MKQVTVGALPDAKELVYRGTASEVEARTFQSGLGASSSSDAGAKKLIPPSNGGTNWQRPLEMI